jgi:hypothetical protein
MCIVSVCILPAAAAAAAAAWLPVQHVTVAAAGDIVLQGTLACLSTAAARGAGPTFLGIMIPGQQTCSPAASQAVGWHALLACYAQSGQEQVNAAAKLAEHTQFPCGSSCMACILCITATEHVWATGLR